MVVRFLLVIAQSPLAHRVPQPVSCDIIVPSDVRVNINP
jgi:hypothetical protein